MNESLPPQYISEIFALSFEPNTRLGCFQLTPNVPKELCNKISYHLGKFSQFTIIYHEQYFWVLGNPNLQVPNTTVWQKLLNDVCESLKEKYGDHNYKMQWHPTIPGTYLPIILSKLAAQVLRDNPPFKTITALTTKYLQVTRTCNVKAEILTLANTEYPAVNLATKTKVNSLYNLTTYYREHSQQSNPEFLIGLEVQEQSGSIGTIIKLAGVVKDRKDELMPKARTARSKRAWEKAPADELVVTIKYNRDIKQYDYPLSALSLYLNDTRCQLLGIDYMQVSQAKKISYFDRQSLMDSFVQSAKSCLANYKFMLHEDNVGQLYQNLFASYTIPFKQTPIQFGKGVVKSSTDILKGLEQGGVYHRLVGAEKVIQIGVLQLCKVEDGKVQIFLNQLQARLKSYGFASTISNHLTEILSGTPFEQRARAEQKAIDLADETDFVLIFLPTSDRKHDELEGGSLYHRLTRRLLRMQKPKQVIYQDTLTQNPKWVLHQVVPAILAKLGNTPYILADPLEIAEYFIGLDVSRKPKKNLPGSMNACASVCVYGRQGQFIGYQIEPGIIEGEEIPASLLESCLSNPDLRGKTVLIYRDGLFRGDEIRHLLNWSSTQNSKLILVECRKSGNSRLYTWTSQSKKISPPPQGLGMRLAGNQVILVTTDVSPTIGVAQPIRLTVRPEGQMTDMGLLVHASLCLTLLHYGSLKKPRLPVPLFGADLLSSLALQGILTHNLYGTYQFW